MKKLLVSLALYSLTFCNALWAQVDTTIYDNDPTQRRPKGMEIPAYKQYKANGSLLDTSRIEPAFWWVGMKDQTLELMIHDTYITDHSVTIKHKGVKIKKIYKVRNPNYLFVELTISPKTKPGKFPIQLTNGINTRTYEYELKERATQITGRAGVNAADMLYLLMPDRFANGDPTNDSFKDMKQVGINREKMYFRHGGDLQGVMNHIDYLKDLGVTGVWMTPFQESDQYYESYHGYACTDMYQVDKRYGTMELFLEYVKKMHANNMKVVMDIVPNHIGLYHWWMEDLPAEDWIHQFAGEIVRPNYRDGVWFDPHVSQYDKNQMANGWFDYTMPDLNQKHPRLARQLIQLYIWWIEYAQIDAYRIDTYIYPDQEFMAQLNKAILEQYPTFSMFGETWVTTIAGQASFTHNTAINRPYDTFLPGVTDFQIYFALLDVLTKPFGWESGLNKLYLTLTNDFLYENPYRNVTFLDNHDASRIFSIVGENIDKAKSGIALLMTLRGIPCLYYGTEILMKNYSDPDGKVREDFPGGWAGDPANKFTAAGRTDKENDFFNYVRKLANYRKNTLALQTGKTTQFIPQEGVYVFFRTDDKKKVMVVANTNDKAMKVPTTRFSECTRGSNQGKDVVTDKVHSLYNLEVPAGTVLVLELQ